MRENTLNPRVIADATEKLVGGWWDENENYLLEVIELLLADYGGAVCARRDVKTKEETTDTKHHIDKIKSLASKICEEFEEDLSILENPR